VQKYIFFVFLQPLINEIMDKKERILFIINPISGVGKQKKAELAIEETLDKERFSFDIAYTKYAHHATAMCLRVALRKNYDIVAIVGGDGSINDCVRGLENTDIKLAIIPAGSGNGLARTLKIPLNINQAIQAINHNKSIYIDTITLNDTICASIAGIGFDALVAKEFAKTKTRGFNTYFQIIASRYPFYKPKYYVLEIDGTPLETEALFICFANSNQFGYNTIIAPSASLTDGYIDVICVRKIPITLLPFVANLLFTKMFDHSIYVKTYKAKQVRILSQTVTGINIDGEYSEIEGNINLTIKEKTLHIIIP
jgi:YegS/Rv2252/BmrU family lipid kinase